MQELADKIVKDVGIWVAAIMALFGVISPLLGLITSALIAGGVIGPDSKFALFIAKLCSLTFHAQSGKPKLPPVGPAAILLLAIGASATQVGCSGTFDESTARIQVGTRKLADPALCSQISSRARWEQGLAVAGAALTGASGIAAWPIESKDGRFGLAIGATVAASGTALVLTLWQADAAEYLAQGCGQPKAAQ